MDNDNVYIMFEELKEFIKCDAELKECFKKYANKGLRKDFRYGWLRWLHIEFVDELSNQLKPYIGLQIYPYSICINDIGNLLEDEIIINNDMLEKKKNIFPYDCDNSIGNFEYHKGNRKYYLIGRNMDIDLLTGNIMQKNVPVNKLQIWLCQKGYDHIGIQEYGLSNDYLKKFYESVYKNGKKDYEMIKKYYNSLLDERLVSKEIKADNYDEIAKEIKSMIEYCINKHK